MHARSLGALLTSVAVACHGGPRPLRLGTTYTVQESGALAALETYWAGAPLAVVVGPSGQILRSAAQGDLDVVITHAPALDARILGAAHTLLRCPLVASRFAVVGPPDDPARVAAAATARDAFARIARRRGPFVSRGDSSGTHVNELAQWHAAGASVPPGPWYIESGADQATTLHIADERNAYALADLPTYAKLTGLGLQVLFANDTALTNPYTLYVVRAPDEHPAAQPFARWVATTARARIPHVQDRSGVRARPVFVGDADAEQDPVRQIAGDDDAPASDGLPLHEHAITRAGRRLHGVDPRARVRPRDLQQHRPIARPRVGKPHGESARGGTGRPLGAVQCPERDREDERRPPPRPRPHCRLRSSCITALVAATLPVRSSQRNTSPRSKPPFALPCRSR